MDTLRNRGTAGRAHVPVFIGTTKSVGGQVNGAQVNKELWEFPYKMLRSRKGIGRPTEREKLSIGTDRTEHTGPFFSIRLPIHRWPTVVLPCSRSSKSFLLLPLGMVVQARHMTGHHHQTSTGDPIVGRMAGPLGQSTRDWRPTHRKDENKHKWSHFRRVYSILFSGFIFLLRFRSFFSFLFYDWILFHLLYSRLIFWTLFLYLFICIYLVSKCYEGRFTNLRSLRSSNLRSFFFLPLSFGYVFLRTTPQQKRGKENSNWRSQPVELAARMSWRTQIYPSLTHFDW